MGGSGGDTPKLLHDGCSPHYIRLLHHNGNLKAVLVQRLSAVYAGDEELPADIVPLACSGSDGQCYVSTVP